MYLQDTQIHWFSIVNSVVVVFFLSGIITMIIIRTLRRDIAKYNMADDDIEESIEETGNQSGSALTSSLLDIVSMNPLVRGKPTKMIKPPKDGSWFTEMFSDLLSTIGFLRQSLGLGSR